MENKRLNTLLAAGCVAAFFAPLHANAETIYINSSQETLETSTTNDYDITGSDGSHPGILNINPDSSAVSLKGATLNGYATINTDNKDYGIIFTDNIVINAMAKNNILDFSSNPNVTITNGINVNNGGEVNINWVNTPESMGTLSLGQAANVTFTPGGTKAINIGNTSLGQNAVMNANGTVKVTKLTSAPSATVNIGAANTLNIAGSDEEGGNVSSIGNLHMGSTTSKLDLTSTGLTNKLNTVNISSMDSDGKLTVDLDFAHSIDPNYEGQTSDYIGTDSETPLAGKFDLSLSSSNILNKLDKNGVAFIKIADDNININSLPATGSFDNSNTIKIGSYYVSYNNDGTNFEPNTIRLTNYDVYTDGVLNAILLRGERSNPTTNYTNASLPQLPNMEASEALPGELTLTADNSSVALSGANTALLTVDSSDGYSRTLNLGGLTLETGDRSAASNTSLDEFGNPTFNGAALYINKGTGTANVNFIATTAGDVGFVENTAPTGVGGAIYNNGGIVSSSAETITSDTTGVVHFLDNDALSGGAIYNNAGDFTFNYGIDAQNNIATTGDGGAIYNNDTFTIADGTSTFSGNTADAGNGGAVYNNGVMDIAGTSTLDANTAGTGGAIYNAGIATLAGANFTNNSAVTAEGGAIYNVGSADIANSSFSGNIAATDGGAIYNDTGSLGLTGNASFVSNTATGDGGAIYNTGIVESNSNLVLNSNKANNGGALYNTNVLSVGGNSFTASDNTANLAGGALYNAGGTIAAISAANVAFEGNSAATGGAVYNTDGADLTIGTSGVTSSIFALNSATNGGAIANDNGSTIDIIGASQTFEANQAASDGGAIHNLNSTMNIGLDSPSVYFASNSAASNGGAIYNEAATLNIGNSSSTTTFSGNTAGAFGGAIASVNNDLNLYGNQVFTGNTAGYGGAIASNTSTVNMVGTQTFTNNVATGRGGAIYMVGTDETNRSVINLTSNVSGSNTVFSGNSDSTGANAIYMDGNSTLNLVANNGSSFVFDDPIAGNANSNIINQSGSAYYNGNNSGFAGDFNLLSGGNAYFTAANSVPFQGGNYSLGANSTLHLMNGRIETINANSLTLPSSGTANITIDLDLTSATSDKFNLSRSTVGNLLVTNMNVTGDTDADYVFFPIAQGAQVSSTQSEIDTSYYTYDVIGGNTGLTLMKGDISDTALQAGQVAANAATLNQMALYNQLLFRVDEIAESRYFTSKNKPNLYAATTYEDHPTIDDTYTPYVNQQDGGCVWFKPATTIETVSPNGFSGYKNRSWNALLGYETPIATLRSGFEIINTVFGGYQGSYQDFDDAYNYQNGGFGGYMANIYKKNFFMGFTALAGGIGVQTTDDGPYNRGQEFGLFNAGAAMRVGYNVGMGKHWLLQPIMTAGYTLISGYNDENDRGEDVAVKPTNTLQLAPGFKIIGNYNGWQPYALFDYTWALGSRTLAHVNDVTMPEMRIKSYVEYGVGLRKNMGERFTGYLEAVMRNGGRTGPTFQGGLTFKF